VGYYTPNYGQVNELFENMNKTYGTNVKFKSGLNWGLNLNYELSSNWRMRGEYIAFDSKTSDSYVYEYELFGTLYRDDIDYVGFEVNLRALILSGIYRFSPNKSFCPYAGLGIGLFLTELKGKVTGTSYYYDPSTDKWQEWLSIDASGSDNASPIGFQILAGVEYKVRENFSIAGEIKYVIGKAEDLLGEEGWESFDVDWSGLSAGLGVVYSF